jgi:hypothetical protein
MCLHQALQFAHLAAAQHFGVDSTLTAMYPSNRRALPPLPADTSEELSDEEPVS